MLLEIMIVNLLGGMILLGSVSILMQVTKQYILAQQKFGLQQNMLISRYYLRNDISGAFSAIVCAEAIDDCDTYLTTSILRLKDRHSIKPQSDILILQHENSYIIYYLRKSIVPGNKTNYALYRDDGQHNAAALVENILDFTANIHQVEPHLYNITAILVFEAHRVMEIECTINQATVAAS